MHDFGGEKGQDVTVVKPVYAAPQVLKKMILDAAGTASADGRKVVDLLVAFALQQVGLSDAETFTSTVLMGCLSRSWPSFDHMVGILQFYP